MEKQLEQALARKESLLRLRDVLLRTGLSRATTYQCIKDGSHPAPIPLQGRTRAWVESDIDAWIASRIAAARGSGKTEGKANG